MSEIFNLKNPQTISCDECNHELPHGRVWFCPECSDNLCNECNDLHCCNG